ncbi:MAG: 1-deoxy-D-xylulose-5-phosphate reductoisomerase [SAR86 cluster bacterium]|uniref:1-deoxy-D-xylulose 5-phosphate reductoisomerase n=1 Tax=SAR86 cluster bacterium TaxID=2030880 RepID=A0A2A5AZ45_9GAMM|nr:MAG: 1-deoxy-D-xylulose-5-phosphate reductoisomerase [SAR86 cluster bacterium]
MSTSNTISILGSTGSVGCSTLAVIDENPQYKIYALSANNNTDLLHAQCLKYKPRYAVVADEQAFPKMKALLAQSDIDTELLTGENALSKIASDEHVDTVMAAIVGAAGLESTLAAVSSGKRVLLANKEALVMTGDLLKAAARSSGAALLPIDSEHNAIFQCLPHSDTCLSKEQFSFVEKVVLTASGGPFLNTPSDEFEQISPDQACRHPKWSMGRKISVDSATMMNKGLEFIEACHLFELEPERVEVVIHPQSIIHSMVYYRDGSVLAQMANPDMRIPIASGLAWPQRINSGASPLDLISQESLQFLEPDLIKFPCLRLGIEAAQQGGTAPAILNAANEIAVAAFLDRKVSFPQIPLIIEAVRSQIPCEAAVSLAIIRDVDQQARILSNELILKDFS